MTEKLIWLSDLHFDIESRSFGINTIERLEAAIEYINARYKDATHCFITGDLLNLSGDNIFDKSTAPYKALRAVLDTLTVPYFVMPGNHDNRDTLMQALPVPQNHLPGFVQYTVETDSHRFLCLDTVVTGQDGGHFCETRMAWLDAELSKDDPRDVFIFMHHQPVPVGYPVMDSIMVENGDALVACIRNRPQLKQIFIGHLHRPISGNIEGTPFTAGLSTAFQLPLPIPPWDMSNLNSVPEGPYLGVILLNDGQTIIQQQQFCDHSVGLIA